MTFVPSSVYKPLLKDDVSLLRERQYKNWEQFFLNPLNRKQSQEELPGVRDVILQSWNRCKDYESLTPMIQGSVKNISNEDLEKAQNKHGIFHLVQPVLKEAQQELTNTNHAILYCDSDGVILDCYGDASILRQLGNSTNATKGAQWTEQCAGTNAIGTSMILKQPVQIFSSEHFAHSCHDWVCAASPILNPLTNELMGVINLSTSTYSINPISMMKAIEIANKIERMVFHHQYQAREMMQTIYIESILKWKNHIVVLCDPNGKILKLNRDEQINELHTLISDTLEKNKFLSITEWENEAIINDSQYQARYKKLFWQGQLLGMIAVLEKRNRYSSISPKHNQKAKYSFQSLIGKSDAYKKILKVAHVAAFCDSNVLITGDSGTGKELISNAIHKASNRSSYPFVAMNCAAIPKDLLPSELFGYVAGAFTGANPKGSVGKFELANKGTIFLDEIGDMPLESQVQLLRVIQEQEIIRIGDSKSISIDVRIIAATNKNFAEEIQQGTFRKDLYYRINVIPIELPSLCERSEDIPILAEHFTQKYSIKKHQEPFQITAEAMEILKSYSWPGNIRELENVIEYAVNFSNNGIIAPNNLPKDINSKQELSRHSSNQNPVNQAELDWILTVLKRSRMNVSKAAEELKMSRSTVYRKLKKLGYDIKNLK